MNYAFHIDLGDMPMTNGTQCTQHQRTKPNALINEWGPEHVGKSSENSVIILAQINDEEKLTEHEICKRHGFKDGHETPNL